MADDDRSPAEQVMMVLAVSVGISLIILTFAALWAAFVRMDGGHSLVDETALTQILLAWGSSMIAVLAAFTGYHLGRRDK
jgi:cation transporter-like permease